MEQVILVNEDDQELGIMEKMEAHQKAALHRAFSVFIFNTEGKMLLQRRALSKYHSPGLWTNACCSHPRPGEQTRSAAIRRVKEELGIDIELVKIFHFTYQAHFANGLSEHEFDHVYLGNYEGTLSPNPEEVMETSSMDLHSIEKDLKAQPDLYTAWFHIAFPRVREWINASRENAPTRSR